MNDWLNQILNGDFGPTMPGGAGGLLFVMLLGFTAGQLIGFVYMWTHESISYSRTFVGSLVVMPVLIALMMVVMAGSLVVAFGLLAVFGVIRFRNVLKDTRDTMFVLWSITEGLAIGTLHYTTALVAGLGVALVFLYLRLTSFGTLHRYDAVLSLHLSGGLSTGKTALRSILLQHAFRATLINERSVPEGGADASYRLLLRDPSRLDELQAALVAAEGVSGVSIFMHEDEAEI